MARSHSSVDFYEVFKRQRELEQAKSDSLAEKSAEKSYEAPPIMALGDSTLDASPVLTNTEASSFVEPNDSYDQVGFEDEIQNSQLGVEDDIQDIQVGFEEEEQDCQVNLEEDMLTGQTDFEVDVSEEDVSNDDSALPLSDIHLNLGSSETDFLTGKLKNDIANTELPFEAAPVHSRRGFTVGTNQAIFSIILVGVALIGVYVIGLERGRHGLNTELTQENKPTLSMVNSGAAQGVSKGHEDSVIRKSTRAGVGSDTTSGASSAAATSVQMNSKRIHTLILAQYNWTAKHIAENTMEKLRSEGFKGVGLGREKQLLYLYIGSFSTKDHPQLKQYFDLFRKKAEYSDCFLKTVYVRMK